MQQTLYTPFNWNLNFNVWYKVETWLNNTTHKKEPIDNVTKTVRQPVSN